MADVIITGDVITTAGTGGTTPAISISSSVEPGATIQGSVSTGGIGSQGVQGDQGIQGIQGIQGPPGNDGAGVPTGGTTGQVLKKNSNTDNDTVWSTPAKSDIGLSNVDNTADLSKPISTTTQAALDAKANDNAVVHLTGVETVAGAKTWSDDSKFSGNVGIGVSGTILDKLHISSGYTRYSDTYGVRFGSTGTVGITGSQTAGTLSLTATTTTASGELQSTAAGTNTTSVVTVAGTQNMTNKTLTAPVLSGTITGTYTIGGTPTFPSTVVSTTGTQTLTNKTLTSPVINSPSGFLSGAAKITVGTSTPISPTTGDLWIDTN